LVVLVVIVGAFGLSISVVGLLTFSDLNGEAARLASTIQHIYGRAAINGQRYRLVIDLDDNAYWAECSDEDVPLPGDLMSTGMEDSAASQRLGRYDEDDEEADPFGLNLDNTFDDCTEELIPRRQLTGRVVLDSVMTTHQREPAIEGQATIEFFPDGFVEPSMVWLTIDDAEAAVTLTIQPMTGRVRTFTERLEVPSDFLEVEEDR
jgi:hypothetical protein